MTTSSPIMSKKKQTILVTGATGYMGSHACVALLENDYGIVAIDNMSNSNYEALKRVEAITGRHIPFYLTDVRDRPSLDRIFKQHHIQGVMHFAGLKAVGDSVVNPLLYYDNNVNGTLTLLHAMKTANVKHMIFSSSATVYGEPAVVPVPEIARRAPLNPYGRSKWMIEEILQDLERSDPQWNIGILRYGNPSGAHPSGLIGEAPKSVPQGLFPSMAQVAVGKRDKLAIYGSDYPTRDGTTIRDYIHIMDLVQGHVMALEYLFSEPHGFVLNLGAGEGHSVLEVVRAFETASGKNISYQFKERRPGDVPCYYVDPTKALELLGWKVTRDLETMCADFWRWQEKNPNGYGNA